MKKFLTSLAVVTAVAFTTTGCAEKALPASRAGAISQGYSGVIKAIENTQIQGDGQLTSIGGMIAGGIAGNQVGGGSGQDLATMAGAMIGSVLGQKADVRPAKRVTVALSDGRVITTVLPVNANNPLNFSVGSAVTVYITNGRVTEIR
jgi:outer membrane lipoprotein SlyB